MKTQTKYIMIGIAILAILILVANIVINGLVISKQYENEIIKIGIIGTLTGPGAYHGQQELRGVELAKKEINNKGGINGKKIELIIEDSKADPVTAVNSLNKLINMDRTKFVIGDSWVSTTAAIVPIANENQIIIISPLASLNSLSNDDMFFRTIPSVREMMSSLADYAYYNLGSRKVGILSQKTPFGAEHAQYFKESFEKLGGQIIGEESFSLTSNDVRTEITKIKEKNPDTILNLHATGPMIGLLIKQANELNVNVDWLGSFGSENAPLVKEYGSILDGLTYPYAYDANSKNAGVQKFIKAYEQKYNELPDLTAANSYDSLMLLSEAIKESGENPTKVKQALLNVNNYDGASGFITFDKNGDVKKPILIKQIQNGSFIPLS